MVDAVLSFTIEKLGRFITQKLLSPGEVQSNAEWLQEELKYMKSFLRDAEKKQTGNELVSLWITDIKNISNDVVYVLEDFEFKMGEDASFFDRLRSYTSSIFTKEANAFDIGVQMKLLKQKVGEISRKRGTYGIKDISSGGGEGSSPAVKKLRRSTSYTEEDQLFVGLEDVKQNLMSELLKNDPHRCMVSIYSPGGSGKTSLARSLYHSKEVLTNFPYRAWTYVSQEYTIPEVLLRVIKSLKRCSNDEVMLLDKMNEEDLERYLRQLLEDKKYLVVIDDVWDINVWGSLKRAFPDYHNHSRVIVTTRNKGVATQMGERISAHQIRLLNSKESWKLFLEKLGQGDERPNWCSQAMLEVGQEMVTKCDGLPLAIIVLGGLLTHKKSLHDWQAVKKRIWSHLISGSVEISNLLVLSYDDLASELKLCFLYIGVYPEDCEFNATRLMWFWIAEEFIKQGVKGEEMEDIAQAYLNELINRDLVQVTKVYWGEIGMCRIHDLVRNLAVEKAIEVDFFDIYNPFTTTRPSLHHRVRRQVVHRTEIQRYLDADHTNSTCLRSLLMYSSDVDPTEYAKLVGKVRKFSRLCTLHLELRETPKKLMNVIGSLKQLKLLIFSTTATNTVYLPPTIGNLTRLKTLVFSGASCHLPEKISKLQNLKHLICLGIEGNIAEIGKLSNLQTLYSITYEHWIVILTHNLVNLRALSINDIKKQNGKDYSLESISKLKNLHALRLVCEDKETGFPRIMDFMSSLHKLRKVGLYGKLKMLPSIEKWPHSITMLMLKKSEMEEDPIPTLAKLPNLIRLDLDDTHKASMMSFPPQSFPQLEQLGLSEFTELKKLELEEGALPIIKSLHVMKCKELKDSNMPERLKSILIHGQGDTGFHDRMYELYVYNEDYQV